MEKRPGADHQRSGLMNKQVLIFGAGYSGKAIARELLDQAYVAGTTRNPEKAAKLSALGIEPFLYRGEGLSVSLREALARTTHLLVSIGPGEGGDPVLSDLIAAGGDALPALKWIGYLSTVGVYGDHGCAWVDENSECRPVSPRSSRRREAEKAWLAFGRSTKRPVAVLRLSGIYGPGRNAFVSLSEGTAKRIVKPGQVFNRVHLDDVAGATCHLMRDNAEGIFNIADDEPSPPQDVVADAARLMGVEPPPEIPFEKAEMSLMARSFYGECKRVSNAKLKASGYHLRHPNYRESLPAMWQSGTWKSGAAKNML